MIKCKAARLAVASIALICAGLSAATASATDRDAFIWAPSKTGANAYRLRAGVRLPGRWDATAGAEISMRAAPSGKLDPPDAPFRLWGLLSRKRGQPAAARSTQINMDFNALSGVGNIGLGTARTWIVTPALDAEVRRNLSLQCNAYENHCRGPSLTQSARVIAPATRTSVVVHSHISDDGLSGLSRIGVEQKVGNLQFGAAVVDPLLAPRSVFDVRYSLRW
jgi:hypothetical protein